MARIAASQRVASQDFGGHVKDRTDQPVWPVRTDRDFNAEHPEAATRIGAPEEDDLIGGCGLMPNAQPGLAVMQVPVSV